MEDFTGSKVALFYDGKLVVFLRDDKPSIPNPGMWDFFGGAREANETPAECAIREIEEELGIRLRLERLTWSKLFPLVNEPEKFSWFMVAHLTHSEIESIQLTEGQRWEIMEIEEFLSNEDAIEGMKVRLRDYLATQ